jgi:SpoVK/Ycf46/Vps4 family AAA+-type ATPase
MVMFSAKAYQPSVIYIDEVEKVFPSKGKKKGKKGGKGGKKGNELTHPSRIKKAL